MPHSKFAKAKLIGLAALLGVAAPVSARLVDVTWTGVVAYADDQLGLFGAPGTNLRGQRFVASYRIETSRGYQMTWDGAHVTEFVLGGGPFDTLSSPVETASLAIDDHVYVEQGDFWGYYSRSFMTQLPNAPNYGDIFTTVEGRCYLDDGTDDFHVEGMGFQIGLEMLQLPTKLDRSFYWQAQRGGNAIGSGRFEKLDLTNVVYTGHGASNCLSIDKAPPLTGLVFDIDSVRIAVPEPASWALMIAGFGLVGGTLRRRRAVTA